jgi:hypothetical protein
MLTNLTMRHAGVLKLKWLAGGRLRRRLLAPPDTDGRSVQSAHVPRVRPRALYWRHHVCNTHDRAAVTSFIHFLLVHFAWRFTCKLWRGYRRLRSNWTHRAQNFDYLLLWVQLSSVSYTDHTHVLFLLFLDMRVLFFSVMLRCYYTLMMGNHRQDDYGTYVGGKNWSSLGLAVKDSVWTFVIARMQIIKCTYILRRSERCLCNHF